MKSDYEILADVQSELDDRCLTINKVGLREVKVPLSVPVDSTTIANTVAELDLFVELPHMCRGTHMSRLFEEFNRFSNVFWTNEMNALLCNLQSSLESENAYVNLRFPVFIQKKAPVTGAVGPVSYKCALGGQAKGEDRDVTLEVVVPVTTLCPCSRELSEYGAHNQRGIIRAVVRFDTPPVLADHIRSLEECGSCGIYSVLKRPDEKFVTEKAYKQPRFVEDVVREVARKFSEDDNITWFAVEAESYESIHDHNAYAFIKRDKRTVVQHKKR